MPCRAQTFRDFEVLVLDNASTDDSADEVERRWPGFRLVRFEHNLGFAAANNRGAQLARGRWLAFLNNDAFPQPDWLERLVEAAQARPEFAFFASRLVYASDTDRMQAAGDVLNISGFAWSRDNGYPLAAAHLEAQEVFSACAAAAMFQRQAFLDVGGFNADFVSHLEDVDLGFRLRLVGQRCLYVPSAVVAHVVSASYGAESERTVYQVQRNVVWMYAADMPGRLFWKYLPAHLVANLVFLLYYTLHGRGRAAWRAKLDALRGLPAGAAPAPGDTGRPHGRAAGDRAGAGSWLAQPVPAGPAKPGAPALSLAAGFRITTWTPLTDPEDQPNQAAYRIPAGVQPVEAGPANYPDDDRRAGGWLVDRIMLQIWQRADGRGGPEILADFETPGAAWAGDKSRAGLPGAGRAADQARMPVKPAE